MTTRSLLDLFPIVEDARVPDGRILFVRRPGRILGVEAEPRTDEDLALRVVRFRVDYTVPEVEILAATPAPGEGPVDRLARDLELRIRDEARRRYELELVFGDAEALGRVVSVPDPDVGACRACGARSGCEAAATCDPERADECEGEALGFFPDDDEDAP